MQVVLLRKSILVILMILLLVQVRILSRLLATRREGHQRKQRCENENHTQNSSFHGEFPLFRFFLFV